ncbi:MAG: GNAT family N-acetyltransferase [Bacteroidetes bacterium]|nr:GNAT family N-acetyltransferase [Bacteroidota bacterium]
MADYKIITIDPENVEKYGFFCVKNKKHSGYIAKLAWLKKRFKEGMRIKMILTSDGKQAGFLEYIPGEFTWRIVNAPEYLVIHCIWVNSKKFPFKGLASELIQESIKDAELNGKEGVAVVSSDGPWMTGKEIFIKNGFEEVDQAEPHFQLLAKRIGNGPLPGFPQNRDERLKQYQGLQLIYTNQCPYIGKAVAELPPVAKKHGIQLNLVELDNAAEAREKMPSVYGMFNLVYDGQLLADHPISATRFKNILQKDLKLRAM